MVKDLISIAENRDCMEAMAEFPDKFFDLAIVDPPYGININMNMGRRKGKRRAHEDKKWDQSTPNHSYFKELFRVSNNQIIWGGNYFELPTTKSWIFWDKNVPDGVSFADGELAWTSFNITLKKVIVPYSGFVGSEWKIHPTQKPVKLYKWLLKNYGNGGAKSLIHTWVPEAAALRPISWASTFGVTRSIKIISGIRRSVSSNTHHNLL